MTATRAHAAGGEARARLIGVAIGVAAAACATFGVVGIQKGQVRDDTTAFAALTILAAVSFVAQALSLGAAGPNG